MLAVAEDTQVRGLDDAQLAARCSASATEMAASHEKIAARQHMPENRRESFTKSITASLKRASPRKKMCIVG